MSISVFSGGVSFINGKAHSIIVIIHVLCKICNDLLVD